LGINILIVDDHAVVRAGLRAVIQSDPTLDIIAEATGGLEALSLVEKTQPDVIVLDLSMPDMDGIMVTKELHTRYPNIRILILTVHEDEAMLREVMRSGASGYILKHAAEKDRIEAIKLIMEGDIYVDQKMLPSLIGHETSTKTKPEFLVETLSPREVDVLKLIVEGYTNRQIGDELGISVRTVEGHRANIYGKLGLRNRVELVRYAKENGLMG
jgi:DNA-binding NarL/FixJ family response regulator